MRVLEGREADVKHRRRRQRLVGGDVPHRGVVAPGAIDPVVGAGGTGAARIAALEPQVEADVGRSRLQGAQRGGPGRGADVLGQQPPHRRADAARQHHPRRPQHLAAGQPHPGRPAPFHQHLLHLGHHPRPTPRRRHRAAQAAGDLLRAAHRVVAAVQEVAGDQRLDGEGGTARRRAVVAPLGGEDSAQSGIVGDAAQHLIDAAPQPRPRPQSEPRVGQRRDPAGQRLAAVVAHRVASSAVDEGEEGVDLVAAPREGRRQVAERR